MKNLGLVIGIVVILAIVYSPALAVSMSDLIAQHQGQSPQLIERLEFDEDTPLGPAPPYYPWYLTPVIPIPAIEPTTIPTKPTPTPSPLTLDIYVDPFPATLIPSYYEYSKFPAPKPCIYGPPPGMSDEEYWEMLAKARERIPYYPL